MFEVATRAGRLLGVAVTSRVLPIAFALVLSSNGGCGGGGSEMQSTVLGTVDGAGLEAQTTIAGVSPGYGFVFTNILTDHTAIAVSTFNDACGNLDVTGQSLYIDLFEEAARPNSTVTRRGVFPTWLPDLNGAESPPAGNLSVVTYIQKSSGGGKLYVAQSGSVTVTDVAADRISGTFEATFEAGELHGTFEAAFCEPWTRSSTVP